MTVATGAIDLVAMLGSDVGALLRRVAEVVIIPRFRQLGTGDVKEKTPGEIVTVADHEAEAMLSEGLSALLPGSRVVGEEACAADLSVLERLDEGLVWVVDPLDGTAHFAAGREPFGIMVALAAHGETLGGWIYNPMRKLMYAASLGHGASVTDASGTTLNLKTSGPTGLPIAGLATQFMTHELREATLARARRSFEIRPIPRCAAEHYPRLCRGENHIALFQRTLPWDHAAGALIFAEAGGHVARWDGTPFKFYDGGLGILAATSHSLWEMAAEILLSGDVLRADGHEILPPVSVA